MAPYIGASDHPNLPGTASNHPSVFDLWQGQHASPSASCALWLRTQETIWAQQALHSACAVAVGLRLPGYKRQRSSIAFSNSLLLLSAISHCFPYHHILNSNATGSCCSDHRHYSVWQVAHTLQLISPAVSVCSSSIQLVQYFVLWKSFAPVTLCLAYNFQSVG